MLRIDTWSRDNATVGFLEYGNFNCCTLELPWLDNQKNISCIPAGIYTAKKYDSPKHGPVILLEDVYNRTEIEIHYGNYTYNILGCILVGNGLTFLNKDNIPDVVNSKRTLGKLLNLLPDTFMISIERHY